MLQKEVRRILIRERDIMSRKLGGKSSRRDKKPKLYTGCTVCGGELPCLRCAREYRRQARQVGHEPTLDEGIDEGLAPDVVLRAQEVREQGFVGPGGRVFPPWKDREYYKRAGVPRTVEFAQSSARETRGGDCVDL